MSGFGGSCRLGEFQAVASAVLVSISVNRSPNCLDKLLGQLMISDFAGVCLRGPSHVAYTFGAA